MVVIVLLFIGIFISWWLQRDAFNYADETASELTDNNLSWMVVDSSDDLDIKMDQASVVFYWHDNMKIRYSCEGSLPSQPDNSSLLFKRGKCLVYLPGVPTNIVVYQSQLVLVRPQQSLDIELNQAEFRIAENDTAYRYTIDASRTDVDDLSSETGAEFEIRIKSNEASISKYNF